MGPDRRLYDGREMKAILIIDKSEEDQDYQERDDELRQDIAFFLNEEEPADVKIIYRDIKLPLCIGKRELD